MRIDQRLQPHVRAGRHEGRPAALNSRLIRARHRARMFKAILRIWVIALAAAAFSAGAAGRGAFGGEESAFLDAREVLRIEAIEASGDTMRVRAAIAPGYYVYRHRLGIEAGGAALPLRLPVGEPTTDEFFGRTEVYRTSIDIQLRPAGATTAILRWQGCADAGICYPPQAWRIELPPTSRTTAAAAPGARRMQ
ncbi:MAG TPA: protein-disulfide reductase DsbD domain-containing protein, partial [Lysobacter sp.]